MELKKELFSVMTGALLVTGLSAGTASALPVVDSTPAAQEMAQASAEAKLLNQLEGRLTTRPLLPQRLLAQSL